MEADRWQEVDALFARALELSEAARDEFLDAACTGHPELRREVADLLAADAAAATFLEGHAAAAAGALPESAGAEPAAGPARVGPYRLVRLVGEGGMGAVFEAVRDDDEYERRVAVKLLRRGLGGVGAVLRFRAERQALARLEHPNIARLYDGGTTAEGRPYLVMELVEGQPIDRYCAERRLPVEARLALFRAVCAAVQHAHQNLLVHRDIKPGNLLVTPAGAPKLLDFGIAKPFAPGAPALDLGVTRTGLRPMTPAYASPEQVEGGTITTATDVYALGAVLYELLTGRAPFADEETTGPGELERAILEREPERPSAAVGGEQARRLRGDLDNIVLTALRKEPERRYASVEQLSEDVRRHLERLPVRARPDTLRYRAGKFLSRHRLGVGVAATLAAVVLGLLGTVALQARRLGQQSVLAEERRAEAARERDKAEQALAFLVDLFETADPSAGFGETVTARQVLDSGAKRVGRELSGRPEVRATLLDAIGRVYLGLGLYDDAEPPLAQALAERRRVLGRAHPEVAASLHNLALLHQRRARFEEAERLYRQALALRRGLLGGGHPEVARTMRYLGEVLLQRGSLDEAEPYLRQALQIHRRASGPRSSDVGEDLLALGDLARARGRFEESASLYAETLAIHRRAFGDGHMAVADALTRLASARNEQGRYGEAAGLLGEALAIQRRLLAPEHPNIATSQNNLAFALLRSADHLGAEALFREALEKNRARLGPEHPTVAINLNNVATALMYQQRLAEAEPLFRQALAIRRKAFGPQHPEVAQAQANLAELLRRKEEFAEGEALARDSLAMLRELLGPDHLFVSHALVGLGSLLHDKGDLAGAERALRDGVALRRRHLPPGHWTVGFAEGKLGACLLARGRPAEAEPFLVSSHRTLAGSFPATDYRVVEARERLAELRRVRSPA